MIASSGVMIWVMNDRTTKAPCSVLLWPWERRQGRETGGTGAGGGALRVCDRFAVAVDRSAGV
jgi:hypothetical protein